MPIISDWNAADFVMGIAFDDGANAVYGTRARVADTGDWDPANGEMSGRNISDRTAVSGWIVQTDDVRHDRSLAEQGLRHIRPTSIQLLLDMLADSP